MTEGMRSGEVAAAAGVNLQTLRYYERRGLLAEPGRTSGGHRVYPRNAVTLVQVIKAAQRLGFTLDEVADLLDAGWHHHGARPGASLRRQASAKLSEVDARIAALQTIRGTLAAALDAGCDDLVACYESPSCPIPFAELVQVDTPGPAAGSRPRRRPPGRLKQPPGSLIGRHTGSERPVEPARSGNDRVGERPRT